MLLSGAEVVALARAHGADPELAQILAAGALAESGWETEAVGDGGRSIGLFQLHEQGRGAGLSVAARQDPHVQLRVMVPVYRAARDALRAAGYTGAELAWRTCADAERPRGWDDPASAANAGYRAAWAQVQALAAAGGLDPRRAAFLQALRRYWGVPYVWGGKTPRPGFDCSGLVTYCAREAGLVPDLGDPAWTDADGLRRHTVPVALDAVLAGDLLLFERTYGDAPGYATHVGVSLGAGTLRMVDTHAPRGVGETDLRAAYWQDRLLGAWRPRAFLRPADDAAAAGPGEAEMERIAELEAQLAAERSYSGGLLTVMGHVHAALAEALGRRGAAGWRRVQDAAAELARHQPAEGWPAGGDA